jgi:hypothetical protein
MADTSGEESISHFIALHKQGDREAAQVIWQHYNSRLVGLARARLRGLEGCHGRAHGGW